MQYISFNTRMKETCAHIAAGVVEAVEQIPTSSREQLLAASLKTYSVRRPKYASRSHEIWVPIKAMDVLAIQ